MQSLCHLRRRRKASWGLLSRHWPLLDVVLVDMKRWFPLEANPSVLKYFASNLGLDTSKVAFCDVFSLDEVRTTLSDFLWRQRQPNVHSEEGTTHCRCVGVCAGGLEDPAAPACVCLPATLPRHAEGLHWRLQLCAHESRLHRGIRMLSVLVPSGDRHFRYLSAKAHCNICLPSAFS